MRDLAEILGPDLSDYLSAEPPALMDPDGLDELLDRWAGCGVEVIELGRSREGRAIRAAVIKPEAEKRALAWGFPHPDEPLGAQAAVWLAEGMINGELAGLEEWGMVVVPCADPDQARRQNWFSSAPVSAEEFACGAWRPQRLGLEVDYGFPINWGPFYQPSDYEGRCRDEAECEARHGGPPCPIGERPFGPLGESLALAAAIEHYRPRIVFSLHGTHTGGDYTFLMNEERREVHEDLTDIPAAVGRRRHLGEPIDRGPRWRRNAPDLIRERLLAYKQARLERMPGYDSSYVYAGNASAANFIEAFDPSIQFVCPETTMFSSDVFADQSPLGESEEVMVAVEDRRRGRYRTRRIEVDGEWIVAEQIRAEKEPLQTPRQERASLTRGMLGIAALTRRRRTLGAADGIWARVSALRDLVPHPYMTERARTSVPGEHVHDGSALIFRTRPDYRREATRAQAASFRYLWPLHTVSLLANFQNFLSVQDPARPEIEQAKNELTVLQETALAQVPKELRTEEDRAAAIRSVAARMVRLMQAR